MFTVTVGEKAFGFVVPFCFLTLCDFSAEKIHTVYDVCSFSSHAYRQNCFHSCIGSCIPRPDAATATIHLYADTPQYVSMLQSMAFEEKKITNIRLTLPFLRPIYKPINLRKENCVS